MKKYTRLGELRLAFFLRMLFFVNPVIGGVNTALQSGAHHDASFKAYMNFPFFSAKRVFGTSQKNYKSEANFF